MKNAEQSVLWARTNPILVGSRFLPEPEAGDWAISFKDLVFAAFLAPSLVWLAYCWDLPARFTLARPADLGCTLFKDCVADVQRRTGSLATLAANIFKLWSQKSPWWIWYAEFNHTGAVWSKTNIHVFKGSINKWKKNGRNGWRLKK